MRGPDYFGQGDVGFRKYNDHLEKVEDLIFNLVNEIDVEQNLKLVEQYRRQLTSSIDQPVQHEEEFQSSTLGSKMALTIPSVRESDNRESHNMVSPSWPFIPNLGDIIPVVGSALTEKIVQIFQLVDKDTVNYSITHLSSQSGGWQQNWLWQKSLSHANSIGDLHERKFK